MLLILASEFFLLALVIAKLIQFTFALQGLIFGSVSSWLPAFFFKQ